MKIAGKAYGDLQEYKMLDRVVGDQIEKTLEGIQLRPKKDISSKSLQNPYNEDATFRTKAGEKNKGYVGNDTIKNKE